MKCDGCNEKIAHSGEFCEHCGAERDRAGQTGHKSDCPVLAPPEPPSFPEDDADFLHGLARVANISVGSCQRLEDIANKLDSAKAPPEPSGLWACWGHRQKDFEVPTMSNARPVFGASYQLPALMTAGEIAGLTVGDCRWMKEAEGR
jgi:hypothetical protein